MEGERARWHGLARRHDVLAGRRVTAGAGGVAASGILHVALAELCRAVGAARGNGGDGDRETVCVCGEPFACDAIFAHAATRGEPRPPGPVGRGVFPLRFTAAAAPEGRNGFAGGGSQRRTSRARGTTA